MILTAMAMTAALCCQDYQQEVGLEDESQQPYTEGGALPFDDQATYVVDPTPVEPDPLFTIRPGTPGTGRSVGGGRSTYTLTGSARITVRIPFVGSRTAILGPGTSFTGVDRNRNNIPDELERTEIDIGPL